MDLRDRVADAIARTDHPTAATVHPLMEDYRDHAEAVMGVVEAEIKELEDENQRMREIIADRIVEEERAVQRKILKDPTNPSLAGLLVGLQRSRDIVTSRAREIAEEEA